MADIEQLQKEIADAEQMKNDLTEEFDAVRAARPKGGFTESEVEESKVKSELEQLEIERKIYQCSTAIQFKTDQLKEIQESCRSTLKNEMAELSYQTGFGNQFSTEAIPGALPTSQNSPQQCPNGLFAEQLSGTAFTKPRHQNQRTWLYKIRPTVGHGSYGRIDKGQFSNDFGSFVVHPEQTRWKVHEIPTEAKVNFWQGISTMWGAGDPGMKAGIAIYMYACNTSMENEAFYSSDGDLMIVPQTGVLHIKTEMGLMDVSPREICVIPRGIRFAVAVDVPENRGYICEVFSGNFQLPELGPIGSNGLANPRDFKAPVAWYEDFEGDFKVINKYLGELFEYENRRSCFDAVAWHGNYYPYKYNLDDYCVMNTVSFDHPDPSIFTVLTWPTAEQGVAACDLAIFPPRWMVAEHTFRPPYYHRNIMNEFMGNICGVYDAKTQGFIPGSASLHSCMAGHGPASDVFEKASTGELDAIRYPDTNLAFMFETTYIMKIAPWALENVDGTYLDCWKEMPKNFTI